MSKLNQVGRVEKGSCLLERALMTAVSPLGLNSFICKIKAITHPTEVPFIVYNLLEG